MLTALLLRKAINESPFVRLILRNPVSQKTTEDANCMATIFVKVRSNAPDPKEISPRVKRMFAAQSGGTSAVAMATPTKATLNRGDTVA